MKLHLVDWSIDTAFGVCLIDLTNWYKKIAIDAARSLNASGESKRKPLTFFLTDEQNNEKTIGRHTFFSELRMCLLEKDMGLE